MSAEAQPLIPQHIVTKMVQRQPHLEALAKRARIWDGAAKRLAQNYLRGMQTDLTPAEAAALQRVANGGVWTLQLAESADPSC